MADRDTSTSLLRGQRIYLTEAGKEQHALLVATRAPRAGAALARTVPADPAQHAAGTGVVRAAAAPNAAVHRPR